MDIDKANRVLKEKGQRIIHAVELKEELLKEAESMSTFLNQESYDRNELIKVVVGSQILPVYLQRILHDIVSSNTPHNDSYTNGIEKRIEKASKMASELNHLLFQYLSVSLKHSKDAPAVQRKMVRLGERFIDELKETAQKMVYEKPTRFSSRFH